MPIPQLPGSLTSVEDLKNYIIRLERELSFLMENGLDSTNIFEAGGWRIKNDMLVSKDGDVGMSTQDTAADDVRFFAGPNGAVWFYYVTKTGKLYATDAFITGRIEGSVIIGSEIKTSETAYPRIELSSSENFFKALGSADKSIEISVSTTGTPGMFFNDLGGSALLDISSGFFDILSTIAMALSAPTVSAGGIWTFNNTINGNITGHAASADYADHAGTASAADGLSPSGEIAWGQVLKSGSNIADLETKNLSSLSQNSSYRTVSDSEKSIWNAKAPTESPIFTGTPTAPTPGSADNSTNIATTAFVKSQSAFPGWTTASLVNSWENFGSGFANAEYMKDSLGFVHLRGFVKSGTVGATIFTLPSGYRTASVVTFATVCNNGSSDVLGRIQIDSVGKVELSSGSNNYVSLSGISFYADI